jgi:signal transduction histidine kinase
VPDGAGGFSLFLTAGVDAATWAAIGALPRTHGLLGALLEDSTAIRLADIRTDPRFAGWPAAHPDMGSFLGVPIVAGGEVLAELFLADKQGGGDFTDADQRLVETLAAHAALAVVNAQRNERARELSVAQERTRLARDLHDSVTQTLFSLSLAAESAVAMAGPSAEPALAEQLDRLRDLAGSALAEMRSLVDTLRPGDLEADGLAGALRKRVDLLRRVHDVPLSLTVRGPSRLRDRTLEREVFRVATEALSNALQHAAAGRISVALDTGGDAVRLVVADDGTGFDLAAVRRTSRRLGLTSMRERAEALGGVLHVDTEPGAGTRVTLEVPAGC